MGSPTGGGDGFGSTSGGRPGCGNGGPGGGIGGSSGLLGGTGFSGGDAGTSCTGSRNRESARDALAEKGAMTNSLATKHHFSRLRVMAL